MGHQSHVITAQLWKNGRGATIDLKALANLLPRSLQWRVLQACQQKTHLLLAAFCWTLFCAEHGNTFEAIDFAPLRFQMNDENMMKMMNCVNRLSNDERATTTKKLLYTFLATAVSTIWLERDHGPMVMLKTMDLLAAAVYAKGNGHHWSSLGVLNLRGWHPAWNVLLPGLRVLSIPRCLHVPSTMIIPTSLQSLDITSCRNISYDSFKPVARNLWILKARHITFHFPPMPSLRLLELGEGSRHISDEIIAEMKHLRVLRLYNHAYITDYALENKTRLEELVLCGNQNITTTPIYKKNMPLLRRFIMPGHPWLQDELGYILPKCRTIVTMYYACER